MYRRLGVRDDISMTSHFSILILNVSDSAYAVQHLTMKGIRQSLRVWQGVNFQQLSNLLFLIHIPVGLQSLLPFLQFNDAIPKVIMFAAILPDIHTCEMKTEDFDF